MRPVRIGFVGVGGMGQAAHLRNYVPLESCTVAAIAEIRPDLGRKVAERYGVPKVYDGFESMLDHEKLDGIVAIQPFGMHRDTVPKLLRARVPVLTEKPLAENVESGRAILDAVGSSGVPLYLAYHKRSDPATARALAQIDAWRRSGEVGKLRYIRAVMPPGDWIAHGFDHVVRTDERYEAKGGMGNPTGAFVNYYIHQVNYLRLLLGEDYHPILADPGGVLLVGRSDSGITVNLEMAAHQTSIEWCEEYVVFFERGFVKIELPAPMAQNRAGKVTMFRDPGDAEEPTTVVPTLPFVHAMQRQAENFVAACRGDKTVLCTAEDGYKDLTVATEYIALVEEAERRFGKS
jgi:predicted dehydrogenase